MNQFFLYQAGRSPVELEAATLADAKAQLRAMVRGEAKRCRQYCSRIGGKPHLHWVSSLDCLITLGPSVRSSMWTRLVLHVAHADRFMRDPKMTARQSRRR